MRTACFCDMEEGGGYGPRGYRPGGYGPVGDGGTVRGGGDEQIDIHLR